jgi:hypothetical protein
MSLISVASMENISPSPPQMPAIILSVLDLNNLLTFSAIIDPQF